MALVRRGVNDDESKPPNFEGTNTGFSFLRMINKVKLARGNHAENTE
jgi:hypothetical protein